MKAPSRSPGDLDIAYGADPALPIPEKAKGVSTPKRFGHVIAFAFLEVDLIGRIIRVSFAFDFNVSSNGRTASE
jgi:hypothetical protein